jgi:phytochrome-interacting factor 3
MENGDAENGHFDMQCPTSEGCNSELQVNYSANWGIGHGMEDTGLPSKLPGMLVNEPSLATAGDQALPIINIQDDEMISWLQDPPEDSLDQNYGVDLFGELPVTNIQVFADAFSGQGMIGRTARMQPSGISGNIGNSAPATRDVNADMAMTLGACRAAGLIRQGAGVEAFSQVRTLQPLGTRQPPGITSSSSPSLNQGITETENPFRTSSPMSGSLLVPMLPPKSKPVAAATFNSLPSNNPLVEKSGAMNFPVFARPAALMKANLQSLNMTSILPSNLMRFKSQQGRLVNLETSMSTSSSITELTTQGQTCASQSRRDGSLQTQNELEMQFEAATGSHQSPNVGVDSLSPMPSSVSRKEVQAVAASAGKATYCGTEPKDQDTSHHSSGTTGSAVPTSSDVGVSQTTSIPEVQEPTITSGSGGATVQAYSDPGALQGKSVPEVQEPTITSALGESGNTGLKRIVKEISSAANKKSKKLHVVEEVECTRAEHDSLDVKKPNRGSTAKRNRAAEVHNLSERVS